MLLKKYVRSICYLNTHMPRDICQSYMWVVGNFCPKLFKSAARDNSSHRTMQAVRDNHSLLYHVKPFIYLFSLKEKKKFAKHLKKKKTFLIIYLFLRMKNMCLEVHFVGTRVNIEVLTCVWRSTVHLRRHRC
jgi:hypothetical protein